MSEVHRYRVVKMLTEAVNKIAYDPECDDLRAELDHLRRREKEVRENSPLLIV